MPNLTDWFQHHIKPVHDGVYETRRPGDKTYTYYSRWNGVHWFIDCALPAQAGTQSDVSNYQRRSWRGIAKSSHTNQPR